MLGGFTRHSGSLSLCAMAAPIIPGQVPIIEVKEAQGIPPTPEDEGQANSKEEESPDAEETTAQVTVPQGITLAILREYLNSYFDNTTVHGFKYILIGDTLAERVGWVATVILAFTGAFVLIDSYVSEVRTNPITMTLSKIPVSEVPFPAVTVDSGQVLDHFGYLRRALGRIPVDESDPGNVG